jgi:hypothetical protein
MVKKLIVLGALGGIAFAVAKMVGPDVKRYIEIRKM